jgi:hypothetical protein
MPEARPVEEVIKSIAHRSWELFKADPALYIVASVIVGVLASVTFGIVAAPLVIGFIRIVRHRLRGQPAQLGDIFASMASFVSGLIVFVIIFVCVTVGMMLFVLPGLLVLVVMAFSFHEMAYKDAGVIAAISGSYQVLVKNVLLVVLSLVLVSLLNAVAGITVIGVLLTVPYSLIALTVVYEEITGLT